MSIAARADSPQNPEISNTNNGIRRNFSGFFFIIPVSASYISIAEIQKRDLTNWRPLKTAA
jgi:hypothetical protein